MSPTPAKEPRLLRLLVVDDAPDNLFLMDGLFGDRYRVVQASSGKEALKTIMSSDPPDLVLLDIMMPDMDGYEVLRRIRQHPPTAAIPVIFVTALASENDERLGLDLGALDYITKPVDPELVLQRVEEHMVATAKARRVEQLSEKLARHLSPKAWQYLFHGPGYSTIDFEEKPLTILHADAQGMDAITARDSRFLAADVEVLAIRHRGCVDRLNDGAGLVYFEDPAACVRMAMDLQRSAGRIRLRMGVHTATCTIGSFESDSGRHFTLIGPEPKAAAKMAATAAIGSIVISPDTYSFVRQDIHEDVGGCLVMEEFHDSDLAQVSLTPTPQGRSSAQAISTFAGLGGSSTFAPMVSR